MTPRTLTEADGAAFAEIEVGCDLCPDVPLVLQQQQLVPIQANLERLERDHPRARWPHADRAPERWAAA